MYFYQCCGIKTSIDKTNSVPYIRVFKHLSDLLVFALTTEDKQVQLYKVSLDFDARSVHNQRISLEDVLKTIPD